VKIGWNFYLCFIIPGSIGGVCMYLFWPNTNGLPLEEIAALFGDVDEVAVLRGDVDIEDIARDTKSDEGAAEENEHGGGDTRV
jgi:hypothetical protein